MHRANPRFKVLAFSRNFGHQAAISAGLAHALGDVVAIMSRAARRVTTPSDGSESIGNVRFGSFADIAGGQEVRLLSANCGHATAHVIRNER